MNLHSPLIQRTRTKLIKFLSKKRNLYMMGGGLVVFLLIAALAFSGDDEKESAKIIKAFISTAMTKYDPQEGARFTAGMARQLVEKDLPKIQTAKAKGFRTELKGDPVIVPIEKKAGFIRANVLIFTVEQKPGEPAKEFAHLWEISTQKVGGNWRIAKAEDSYTRQVGGPGAAPLTNQTTASMSQTTPAAVKQPAAAPAGQTAPKAAIGQPAEAVKSVVPGVPLPATAR